MAKRRRSVFKTTGTSRGKRRSVFGANKGRRRFTLPSGNRTLYVAPDRYPRLYEWITASE
jgi:hypothetical protein